MLATHIRLTCSHRIDQEHLSFPSCHADRKVQQQGHSFAIRCRLQLEGGRPDGLSLSSVLHARAGILLHNAGETLTTERLFLRASSTNPPPWRGKDLCRHGRRRRGNSRCIVSKEGAESAFIIFLPELAFNSSRRADSGSSRAGGCVLKSRRSLKPKTELRCREICNGMQFAPLCLSEGCSTSRRCCNSLVPRALPNDAANESAMSSESTSGRKMGEDASETAAASQKGRPSWKEQLRTLKKPPTVGERIMDALVNSTSSPIGSYVSKPITMLHRLDPRVKQAWLLALVVIPARAPLAARCTLVALVIFLSVSCLPQGLWKDQLKRLALLCAFVFVGMALGADGVPPIVQPRITAIASEGLASLPPLPSRYSYVLFKLGPLQMTRRGVAIAGTAASLSFIVLQSASLCLTTTTPEQLAAGLRWFLSPLAILRVPVDEIILTLLLSLRFVGLVFDEVRNLALGVVARGIEWKRFKLMGTVEIFFTLVGRLFRNLFAHAEQISQAMVARGYKGNPRSHQLYFQGKFSPTFLDFIAILGLGLLFVVVWATERGLAL